MKCCDTCVHSKNTEEYKCDFSKEHFKFGKFDYNGWEGSDVRNTDIHINNDIHYQF